MTGNINSIVTAKLNLITSYLQNGLNENNKRALSKTIAECLAKITEIYLFTPSSLGPDANKRKRETELAIAKYNKHILNTLREEGLAFKSDDTKKHFAVFCFTEFSNLNYQVIFQEYINVTKLILNIFNTIPNYSSKLDSTEELEDCGINAFIKDNLENLDRQGIESFLRDNLHDKEKDGLEDFFKDNPENLSHEKIAGFLKKIFNKERMEEFYFKTLNTNNKDSSEKKGIISYILSMKNPAFRSSIISTRIEKKLEKFIKNYQAYKQDPNNIELKEKLILQSDFIMKALNYNIYDGQENGRISPENMKLIQQTLNRSAISQVYNLFRKSLDVTSFMCNYFKQALENQDLETALFILNHDSNKQIITAIKEDKELVKQLFKLKDHLQQEGNNDKITVLEKILTKHLGKYTSLHLEQLTIKDVTLFP